MCKCSFGEGVTIKPDGVNELEPCCYEETERYINVTVSVRICKNCGNVDIVWKRQPDTEEVDLTEERNDFDEYLY